MILCYKQTGFAGIVIHALTDLNITIGVSVNVQDLPAGAYTLSISCQTGSKTIPFVKQ
ncbi:hypothetical protein MASR1M65_05830 [Saprospiraceae bacterium]